MYAVEEKIVDVIHW